MGNCGSLQINAGQTVVVNNTSGKQMLTVGSIRAALEHGGVFIYGRHNRVFAVLAGPGHRFDEAAGQFVSFINSLNPAELNAVRSMKKVKSRIWEMWSTNERYCFRLGDDGNAVLHDVHNGWAIVWQSNTRGKSNARLVMQEDGNLCAFEGDSTKSYWKSDTWREGGGLFALVVQDSGHVVIYDAGSGKAIWENGRRL